MVTLRNLTLNYSLGQATCLFQAIGFIRKFFASLQIRVDTLRHHRHCHLLYT